MHFSHLYAAAAACAPHGKTAARKPPANGSFCRKKIEGMKMDTQSDKKKKKASGARAAKRIILCGLIVYICYLFIAQQFDLSRLSGEDKALDQTIAEAQRTQEELQEQKEAAGTKEYMERVARDKLGYMKPDEKVFIDAKKQ